MKASEVRIGNFVFSGEKLIEVTPHDLSLFLSRDIELNPVPLNEEWLRKFGFEEFNYPDSKSRWFSDDVIELERKRNGCFILKTFEICFVHQFQNVYLDLTGDELRPVVAL